MRILGIAGGSIRSDSEAGVLASKILEAGDELCWVSRLNGNALPEDDAGFDGMILFGGEISVTDPHLRRYFDAVSALILALDHCGKPVLGSCLGAQILAFAFGGCVSAMGFLEFGFAKMTLAPNASGDPLLVGLQGEVALFEMHSDTFSLPQNAILLLEGRMVPNQAFRVGKQCYGFQCHFEATHRIAKRWAGREFPANPRLSPAEAHSMIARLDEEFEIHGAQQAQFADRLMERWLTLCQTSKARRPAAS